MMLLPYHISTSSAFSDMDGMIKIKVLLCGNDFQSQPCELPKSSENDNYAKVNVTENKHRPKPRPPADTTVVYSDHIMKGQPPPPPYEPIELKQATNLQASATVILAGVKVDDTGNSNPPMDYDSCHHLPVEKNYPPPPLQTRMKANYFLFLIVIILIQLEMLNTYQKWQERQRYYLNRQKAIESPEEVLSVIIDGMDQNKTNLPSLCRIPKSCQNLWCLRTHLTGCLIHGVGSYNFIDYLQWSHDCNLTITVLLQSLIETTQFQSLPRKLYAQMDNCVRENKNKYVLAFFSYLVSIGVFAEIELGFLMVGHTHEDIDQTFSCVSRYLKKNDALTIPALEAACKAANHGTRQTKPLEYVVDFKSWLSPQIEEIHGHTNPHVFLFKKDGTSGKCKMYYKNWSHEQWQPHEGLQLLKKLPSRKDLKLVPPTLNKVDLPHLKNDINKYHDVGVLPLTEYAWWKRFLGSFELHYGSLPKESPPCMLEKLDYIRASTSAPPERVPIISKRVQDYHHNQINSSTKVKLGKKVPATISSQKKAEEHHRPAPEPAPGFAEPSVIPSISYGTIAAFRLAKYFDEIPQIGKVTNIDKETVTVQWYIGGYNNLWIEWKKDGKCGNDFQGHLCELIII